MKTWIALFRGINVGGKHIIRMKDLVALLQQLGSTNVKTYIQSGNAVFSAKESRPSVLENRITTAIEKQYGFAPRVLLLGIEDFEQAVTNNPFPKATDDPKTLMVYFLALKPETPDIGSIETLKSPTEQFALNDKLFYLFAPNGIGRSKLANKLEKLLGVDATARNWRSVGKILDLAKQPE